MGSWLGAPLQARPRGQGSVPQGQGECEQGGNGGEVLQVQEGHPGTSPSPAPPTGVGFRARPSRDSGPRSHGKRHMGPRVC